jgi:phosphoribosylaminoimidazole carboxylase
MDRKIRVACIGGGQLGRMMALEAPRLNIEMVFLDPNGSACPAGQVVGSLAVTRGALTDAAAIRELIKLGSNDNDDEKEVGRNGRCDVLTVEIEHVGVEVLQDLELQGINVQPSSRVLSIIRDKFLQKEHFAAHSIPLPPFHKTPSIEEIKRAANSLGLPIMLKSRKGGYDGRGNAVLESIEDAAIQDALQKLGCDASAATELDLYAEGWIPFDCEIAVMVVRSSNGVDSSSYPAVNAIQQDSVCRVVLAPATNLSLQLRQACQDVAQQAIDSLGDGASGMFGVELFLCKDGSILLNEIAPRPHNTGHYTQDACAVSQFENHLRGICGLPLGSTKMNVEAAASELPRSFCCCMVCGV